MASLQLVLLTIVALVSSADSTITRGDMKDEPDDQYNYAYLDNPICGGLFESGLEPECEEQKRVEEQKRLEEQLKDPEWCDVDWCKARINQCKKIRDCGDSICKPHPSCKKKGCPCPEYKKEDLNISVSCETSQSVMNYNLSKLFNLNLDTSQLSVSLSMQVSKYFTQTLTCE